MLCGPLGHLQSCDDPVVPPFTGDYLFALSLRCAKRKAHRWDFVIGPFVAVLDGREVAGAGAEARLAPRHDAGTVRGQK